MAGRVATPRVTTEIRASTLVAMQNMLAAGSIDLTRCPEVAAALTGMPVKAQVCCVLASVGMNQAAIAKAFGCSRQSVQETLTRWDPDKVIRTNPALAAALRIANMRRLELQCLDITPAEIRELPADRRIRAAGLLRDAIEAENRMIEQGGSKDERDNALQMLKRLKESAEITPALNAAPVRETPHIAIDGDGTPGPDDTPAAP